MLADLSKKKWHRFSLLKRREPRETAKMGRNRKTGNPHASYPPYSAETIVIYLLRWRIHTSAAINLFIYTMISPGEQFIRFTLTISTYQPRRVQIISYSGFGACNRQAWERTRARCSRETVLTHWSFRCYSCRYHERSDTNLWTFRSIIRQSRVICQLVSH